MQTVIVKKSTITRLKQTGNSLQCKFCGQEIRIGEICISRQRRDRVLYAHKKCDEMSRY